MMQEIKIVGVGDIMPGGVLAGVDEGYLTDEVLDFLDKGDIRIGTFETALGDSPTFIEEKMNRKGDVIYAQSHDVLKVARMKMDVLSLANNHFCDLGIAQGLAAKKTIEDLGIQAIGAGADIEEASRPAVFNIRGKSVAVVAFCDIDPCMVGWCPYATEDSPGLNPLEESHVFDVVRRNRALYDYVVVVTHWGREYQIAPLERYVKLAERIIASGASLVLGGHTHCLQPIYRYKGGHVVFSMGNFLFPDRIITTPRSTYYPPETVDIHSLPKVTGFPIVEQPSFKVWCEMARYGMLCLAHLSDGRCTSVEYAVSHLTTDNVVEMSHTEYPFQKELDKAMWLIQNHLFVPYHFVKRKWEWLRSKLVKYKKKLLGKLKK